MDRDKSTLSKRVYVANWITVLALAIVITILWIQQHVFQNPVINGIIRNVPVDYSIVNNPSDDDFQAFVNRKYKDEETNLIQYRWTVISTKRLEAGRKLRFAVYKTQDAKAPQAADASLVTRTTREITLPIQDSFYEHSVSIVYHKAEDKFSLEGDKSETDLKSENVSLNLIQGPAKESVHAAIFRSVHAQSQLDPTAMKSKMEASDPIVRRDARVELAKAGTSALTLIDEILSNPNSSYRLRLGSIVALNASADTKMAAALSVKSLVTILRGIGSSDDTLRNESRKFLQYRGSWAIDEKLSAAIGSSDYPPGNSSTTELALADMDLLYNIGITQKDLYRSPRDPAPFDLAVKAFSKAWGLREAARKNAKIYFAKALYGWALALADRSVIDVDQSGRRKPELIKVAQEKFREFLAAAEPVPGLPRYPAPEQMEQARRYLQTPTLTQ